MVHNGAHRGRLRVDQRRAGFHGHCLIHVANLHGKVHGNSIRNVKYHTWLYHHLKAVLGYGELVIARGQIGKDVDTLFVRPNEGFNAGIHVSGRNRGFDDYRRVWIEYPSRHRSQVSLGHRRGTKPQDQDACRNKEAHCCSVVHETDDLTLEKPTTPVATYQVVSNRGWLYQSWELFLGFREIRSRVAAAQSDCFDKSCRTPGRRRSVQRLQTTGDREFS